MNQIQRGRTMADPVGDVVRQADQVCLAQYSAEDFPNVLAASFVEISFAEYNQRLAGAVSSLEQHGGNVVLVPVTAAQMQDTLDRHRLPNTPDGRAQAILLIHDEHA